MDKLILRAIKELEYRAKRMHNRFNFKTEETMKKTVAGRNAVDFESDISAMLPRSNELKFITLDDNHDYAKEVFKTVQKLLVEGNKLILTDGTNEEMNDLVMKESQKIIDLCLVIKDDEKGFKPIISTDKHFFDEKWFVEAAKHIQVSNDISIFVNELNGGETALKIKDAIRNPNDKEIHLYGIDRDIDCGAESRDKGIETARGGIYEASSFWADISFCANHFINFGDGWNHYTDSEFYTFYKEKTMRNQGIFVFNYPFYRLDDISHILRNNELLTAINTNDEVGNIVFVMKYGVTKDSTKKAIQKIEYQSNRLPNSFSQVINYYSKGIEEVKTFRGKYTDLNDMKVEFKNNEDSAEFLFDYYQPKNKLQQMGRPLMEIKPGHIPAMAASEIINGRYVDEVLKKKVKKEFGFDHIHSTKIVKRDIEEIEKKVDKQGNEIIEISEKKSNVIISIALTSDGQYIELFSNESEKENEKKTKAKS